MSPHAVKTLALTAWIVLAVAAVGLLVAARIVATRPRGGGEATAARVARLDRWAMIAGGLAVAAQGALRLLPG